MKRVILMAAMAVMIAVSANAQSDNTQKPSAETTQSVSLSIPFNPSLQYGYELPFARRGTITGRVGLDGGPAEGGGVFGDYDLWMIAAAIDIEPRYYYGLDRRAAHGRSTAGNAGSFFALQVKNVLPLGYVSDSNFDIYGATIFTPMWGMRRVWGESWQFEFTTGYSFGAGWGNGALDHGLHLGVSFGYSF
jgi:hypothetical protein